MRLPTVISKALGKTADYGTTGLTTNERGAVVTDYRALGQIPMVRWCGMGATDNPLSSRKVIQ